MTSIVHTWDLSALLQNITNLSIPFNTWQLSIVCIYWDLSTLLLNIANLSIPLNTWQLSIVCIYWDLSTALQNIVNLSKCSTIIYFTWPLWFTPGISAHPCGTSSASAGVSLHDTWPVSFAPGNSAHSCRTYSTSESVPRNTRQLSIVCTWDFSTFL